MNSEQRATNSSDIIQRECNARIPLLISHGNDADLGEKIKYNLLTSYITMTLILRRIKTNKSWDVNFRKIPLGCCYVRLYLRATFKFETSPRVLWSTVF